MAGRLYLRAGRGHWRSKDDTFLYRELLKRGRSLVIANVDDLDLALVAKAVFERQGSEGMDQVRKMIPPAA